MVDTCNFFFGRGGTESPLRPLARAEGESGVGISVFESSKIAHPSSHVRTYSPTRSLSLSLWFSSLPSQHLLHPLPPNRRYWRAFINAHLSLSLLISVAAPFLLANPPLYLSFPSFLSPLKPSHSAQDPRFCFLSVFPFPFSTVRLPRFYFFLFEFAENPRVLGSVIFFEPSLSLLPASSRDFQSSFLRFMHLSWPSMEKLRHKRSQFAAKANPSPEWEPALPGGHIVSLSHCLRFHFIFSLFAFSKNGVEAGSPARFLTCSVVTVFELEFQLYFLLELLSLGLYNFRK